MSFKYLLDIIHSQFDESWDTRNREAFEALFGSPHGRYSQRAKAQVALRAPKISPDGGIPFAAYIHPSNPPSGRYSGFSFVIFPVDDKPCLVGLVVGTAGLSPDEAILGRPGHARKAQAISSWLNREFGRGHQVAWAKQDPTRTDIALPGNLVRDWSDYDKVFARYGKEIYFLFRPGTETNGTEAAVSALLDLMFEERGHTPTKSYEANYKETRSAWFEHLMPSVDRHDVKSLLTARRYVIIQGPPGTGKTMMATELLRQDYNGRGRTIQFHPNTTYESFIGGLAPVHSATELGLQFRATPGLLMEAAAEATADPSRDYLLHIDEINRADLGKILGEAVFLLEADATERMVSLPYDFGPPFCRTFFLPNNLHILGTMNTADRSIAIVDVAVRRRFAFVPLWPRMEVVNGHGCGLMQEAFQDLVTLFIEHATEDSFALVPGHSYFLDSDEERAKQSLRVNLLPLLEEYLAQGYVSGFAEPIRSYLQKFRSLCDGSRSG